MAVIDTPHWLVSDLLRSAILSVVDTSWLESRVIPPRPLSYAPIPSGMPRITVPAITSPVVTIGLRDTALFAEIM